MKEALKLALEALEKVTTEMLKVRDELAERGARPETNAFHQRLWDSSFKAYTDHALPAATAIKEALAQPEQEPVAYQEGMEVATRAANESWTLACKKMVEFEREACAVLAEKTICDTHIPTGINIYGTRAAKSIRARSPS